MCTLLVSHKSGMFQFLKGILCFFFILQKQSCKAGLPPLTSRRLRRLRSSLNQNSVMLHHFQLHTQKWCHGVMCLSCNVPDLCAFLCNTNNHTRFAPDALLSDIWRPGDRVMKVLTILANPKASPQPWPIKQSQPLRVAIPGCQPPGNWREVLSQTGSSGSITGYVTTPHHRIH